LHTGTGQSIIAPSIIRRYSMNSILPMNSDYENYCRDESRKTGYADSISFPETEAEVAAILRTAYAAHMPVTIQGGRTGLAAAAVPFGGHILNMSRMDRILGLRREGDRFLLRVQPGLVLLKLREAIADRLPMGRTWEGADREAWQAFRESGAWFFPPDPTETTATIGGMAACNASGARTYRYGATRKHVRSLRIVLADGRILALRRGDRVAEGRTLCLTAEDGHPYRLTLPSYQMPNTKNASGYYIEDSMDAMDLFLGSDGTLGVITELELELSPAPKTVWGVSCFFDAETHAIDYTIAVRKKIPEITAIEYFDCGALEILRRQRTGSSAFAMLPEIPESSACCVFAEISCDGDETGKELLYRLGSILEACGGKEQDTWVSRVDSDQERQQFFRHAIPESVNMLIDERRKQDPSITKLAADMSVPDEKLREVMDMYRQGLRENGLDSAIWGHIGNNHLHVNVLPRDGADYGKGKALFLDWARRVTAMGGAVSAEHGVGKLKRDYLTIMYGAEHIREMAALKQQLDPEMLLGRGNLFPPEPAAEAVADPKPEQKSSESETVLSADSGPEQMRHPREGGLI